jgi:hypothetical protein
MNQQQLTTDQDQASVLKTFNEVFKGLADGLYNEFPQSHQAQGLVWLAGGIYQLDNEKMMLGVRAWLEYFGGEYILSLVQAKSDELWNYTTIMGFDMRPVWNLPNIVEKRDYIWMNIQTLVSAANVLANIPKEKIVEINKTLHSLKSMLSSALPVLMNVFMPSEPGSDEGQMDIGPPPPPPPPAMPDIDPNAVAAMMGQYMQQQPK